jgi:DNA-binding response OmpR family regulator
MQQRILVVDDDAGMREMVCDLLSEEGYNVCHASNGSEALQFVEEALSVPPESPSIDTDSTLSLVILDMVMPGLDGLEVCRRIREFSDIPILALSGLKLSSDYKAKCLDLGADDYLTKPFNSSEFRARVKALLRRQNKMSIPVTRFQSEDGYLTIDFDAHRVSVNGKEVIMPSKEFDILKELAVNTVKVITGEQLLREVWGPEYVSDTNLLYVSISNIRAKIEPDPKRPRYIITVSRVGYRFQI